ncbi:MAG: mechanosensitive ion channel family protein, partial [Planctomycetaceae bacterium]
MITWFILRLIRGVEDALADREATTVPTWDPTTARALGKLVRLSVVITAALVAMQSVGLDVSGALAFGGIGGLAVGMAAKDLLANFF